MSLSRAAPVTAPPRPARRAPRVRSMDEPARVLRLRGRPRARVIWAIALGAVLVVGLLLRLWGIKQGLPYAFNADENAHFVPRAIGLFGHSWNPNYFVNPPAYTYVLHIIFAVWFGGASGVWHAYATDPASVFVVARLTAAALGTLAIWLLYLAGSRLFDRRVGLLAAALLSVSFLPVFYAHLALNDAPALAPIALSLWGCAGVLREGRVRDYVIAGIGLGLAAGTKYTGGIVLLPLLGATAVQFFAPGGRRPAVRGIAVAGVLSVAAFLAANPYAVLDYSAFRDGLNHQSAAADDALGKLGLTQDNGYAYYLWTFTWGMGWVPLIAAIGGGIALLRDERRLLAVLAPAPIFFVLFMGSQARFFGRWLMPVFPIVAVLAAYGVLEAAELAARRRRALRPTFLALAVIALCGQGLVYSLHAGLIMSRADTRNLTRDWMVAHVPEGSKVVVEPVVPDGWAQDIGHPSAFTSNGNRWSKYATSRSLINPRTGNPVPPPGVIVNIEDYERTLSPSLIDTYEREGYCWVVTGSTQRGRAEVEPDVVPDAVAYYRALDQRAQIAYRASPYSRDAGPVRFNFDWSFDYYPLAYDRPGPVMTVYKLTGGACAGVSSQ